MDAALWGVFSAALLIGFLVWYYLKQNTRAGKAVGGTFSVITLGFFVVGLTYGAWMNLDEKGYIPHSRETSITAEPSWLVGENKACFAMPVGENHDVTAAVICDKGPAHNIKIAFWGKVERDDPRAETGVGWKCVKKSDGFTCYALN